MTDQQKYIIESLGEAEIELMSYHIDWAKLNSYSDDYDKDYKPLFPSEVNKLTTSIRLLKDMWKDK